MSAIKLPLLYIGTKAELNLITLFDSGMNYSLIHPDYAREITMGLPLGRTRQIATSIITEAVGLDFYINDVLIRDEFLVMPGLSEEVVIGDYTMRKWKIKLDLANNQVDIDPKVASLQLRTGKLQLI